MKITHLEQQDLVKRLQNANNTENEMANALEKAYTKIRAMTEEVEILKIENNLLKEEKILLNSYNDASPPLIYSAPVPASKVSAPALTSWDSIPTQVIFPCGKCQFTCSSKTQLIEHTRNYNIEVPKAESAVKNSQIKIFSKNTKKKSIWGKMENNSTVLIVTSKTITGKFS